MESYDNVDGSADNDLGHQNGDSSSGKLFIGGVAWETSEERFTNYFLKYGKITDSVIMVDKFSGRSRGFGFVTFADPAIADRVLEQEHVIDGRAVEVKRTVPREEMQGRGVQKTKKIFVGGIPTFYTEDELKEYFSSYGIVAEHQIMIDRVTGRSRGFGFVTFEKEDSIDKIFSDGKTHVLGGKQVEIKKAVPRSAGDDISPRHGGNSSKSYGGVADYGGGGYGGKMGRQLGPYDGYGGGNYGGSAYRGYGGSGYGGFGVLGSMYNSSSGYGTPGGYGGAIGYGGGKGYGGGGGAGYWGGGGRGYDGGAGYGGGGKGYGGFSCDGGDGGDGGGYRGYRTDGDASGRFHPYQK